MLMKSEASIILLLLFLQYQSPDEMLVLNNMYIMWHGRATADKGHFSLKPGHSSSSSPL